jgi:hypothetical protein
MFTAQHAAALAALLPMPLLLAAPAHTAVWQADDSMVNS